MGRAHPRPGDLRLELIVDQALRLDAAETLLDDLVRRPPLHVLLSEATLGGLSSCSSSARRVAAALRRSTNLFQKPDME